jgi:uncharacterized protein YndB with AHSA1/START domain
MPDEIVLTTLLPAPSDEIYSVWLESARHSAVTGSPAAIDPRVGGRHTAFDGYIEGVTFEILPGSRVVQSWRTMDFPPEALDTRLEIHLSVTIGGTRLTLKHSELPEGTGPSFRKGWEEHYLAPLRDYFQRRADQRAHPSIAPTKPRSRPASKAAPKPVKPKLPTGFAMPKRRKPVAVLPSPEKAAVKPGKAAVKPGKAALKPETADRKPGKASASTGKVAPAPAKHLSALQKPSKAAAKPAPKPSARPSASPAAARKPEAKPSRAAPSAAKRRR